MGRGQVVLSSGDWSYLLVLESVQQVLTAVLLVAVLHDCSQRLCPRYLMYSTVNVCLREKQRRSYYVLSLHYSWVGK